jgi:deazaflavin-dependent oxidoreductase (nitroreductase family)
MPAEYKKPGFEGKILNPMLGLVIKLGFSPQGGQLLTVRGRKSGKHYTNPVNPMRLPEGEYLVAPRGNTQWSRNLRATGEGVLRLGRKRRPIRVVRELADAEKPPVLLAYLERWAGVTKEHFGIPWPNPSDEDVARVSARTPIFEIADAT